MSVSNVSNICVSLHDRDKILLPSRYKCCVYCNIYCEFFIRFFFFPTYILFELWTWLIHPWIKIIWFCYHRILNYFFQFFIVLVYLDLCIKTLIQVTIHYIDVLKLFTFNFFGIYFDYFHCVDYEYPLR
jgi:hypothetical protein